MNTFKEYFSPCKVNYLLAINEPREDGFHNLTSLVAPINFGDSLKIKIANSNKDSLICNMEGVPCDESNLVIKAAILFRQKTNIEKYFDFELIKRVPHGAGLGGGSSNGAIALKAINELCGSPLNIDELSDISAQMGSDCPLFLRGEAVIMKGRGEVIQNLSKQAVDCIKSIELLVFKPAFSINTGQAYKAMRESKAFYITPEDTNKMLEPWLANPSIATLPLYNNMQEAASVKYPAIEVVLNKLKAEFNVPCLMSGSGSACFVVINGLSKEKIEEIKKAIIADLGESVFIGELK